jgi:phage tail-like protein
MALSAAEMKSKYPMPVYQFRVQVGQAVMSFSEVSGLSLEYDMTVYKESGVTGGSPVIMRMPAQIKDIHLTLKRGIVEDAQNGDGKDLFAWLSSTRLNVVEKRDLVINLVDEEGQPRLTWQVTNAFPNKLDLPSFDAKSNDVAIETLSLTADMIIRQ